MGNPPVLGTHPALDQVESKARRQPDFPPVFHPYETASTTTAPTNHASSSQGHLHQQPPPLAYGQHQQAPSHQPQQVASSAYFIGDCPSSVPLPVSTVVSESSRFNFTSSGSINHLHYDSAEPALYPYSGVYSQQYSQHSAHRQQQNFGLPEQHQHWLNYGLQYSRRLQSSSSPSSSSGTAAAA
ncbi:unnamed protein product, partial [Dibothriocephalus latus]